MYLKILNLSGTRINLSYGKGFVIHELYSVSEAITMNGNRTAVLFNGKVYDNLFPNGINYNDWINGFYAFDGEKIISKIDF